MIENFSLLSSFHFPESVQGVRIWTAPSFTRALHYIFQHPELKNPQFSLSDHSGKYVWKMSLPEEVGGQEVAYKYCSGKKPLRYLFSSSLPVRELLNYQFLHRLRIPAPEVLAIGELRTLGILRKSFIVTEFMENTHDGTCFMEGGSQRENTDLRNEFLEMVIPYLARLHQHCFFHKAFHLRNLLWRKCGPDGMEIFFIDVARCRVWPAHRMHAAIVFDLRTLLYDLRLPEEESIKILNLYLMHNPDCGMSEDQLTYRLRNFRRRWYGNTFNVLQK